MPCCRPQLQARWNYVLDGMVTMGVVSPKDRAAVRFPPIVPVTVLANDAEHEPNGLIRRQQDIGASNRYAGLAAGVEGLRLDPCQFGDPYAAPFAVR